MSTIPAIFVVLVAMALVCGEVCDDREECLCLASRIRCRRARGLPGLRSSWRYQDRPHVILELDSSPHITRTELVQFLFRFTSVDRVTTFNMDPFGCDVQHDVRRLLERDLAFFPRCEVSPFNVCSSTIYRTIFFVLRKRSEQWSKYRVKCKSRLKIEISKNSRFSSVSEDFWDRFWSFSFSKV